MTAHGTIGGATLASISRLPKDVKACPRCGVERKARKSTALCADCQSVLSPSERRTWRAA